MNNDHPLMQELLALPLEDQCLVHRILYYVDSNPMITDREYDMLERDATRQAADNHPIQKPGSDLPESYPTPLRLLAARLAAQKSW